MDRIYQYTKIKSWRCGVPQQELCLGLARVKRLKIRTQTSIRTQANLVLFIPPTQTSSARNGTPAASKQLSRGHQAEEGHRSTGLPRAPSREVFLEEPSSAAVDDAVEITISSVEDSEEEGSTTEEEEEEGEEVDEEVREAILADARALKELAVAYAHPELGVTTNGLQARCFFERASALGLYDQDQDQDQGRVSEVGRQAILNDAKALSELAAHYALTAAALVGGFQSSSRCYFDRASAPERSDADLEAERASILADALALTKTAVDYAHPEMPVTTNGVPSNNYFQRVNAPEDADDDEEARAEILADCAALKQFAVDYMHPEVPVTTNGVPSNNYFQRVNAPEDADDDEEARAEILADCAALKQLAVDYMHPEVPVTTNGVPSNNFFQRVNAPEDADGDEEARAEILADCAALKQLAVDYMHPEIPVTTNGNTARCFFDRGSNEVEWLLEIKGVVDNETEDQARVEILDDAARLKGLAKAFSHPEVKVDSRANVTRCFFNQGADVEKSDSRARAHSDDQFDLDLDFGEGYTTTVTEDVRLNEVAKPHLASDEEQDEEEEGKMSRSPSSILLLEMGEAA